MGKTLMVGNMAGVDAGDGAGFIVAQYCEVVDLDGPAGMAHDPWIDEIYDNGEIFVPERIWGVGE